MREELDWQAPRKTTPQKLARVQRATQNPIPECASQSLYIAPQTEAATQWLEFTGDWLWEAEAACCPLHPVHCLHSLPQLAPNRHLVREERKGEGEEGRGGAGEGGLAPC